MKNKNDKMMRLSAPAYKALTNIKASLSKRAGSPVTMGSAIDTAVLAAERFMSDEAMQRLANMMDTKTQRDVVKIVKLLMGQAVTIEQDEEGVYTLRAGDKYVVVGGLQSDVLAALQKEARTGSGEPEVGH